MSNDKEQLSVESRGYKRAVEKLFGTFNITGFHWLKWPFMCNGHTTAMSKSVCRDWRKI